MKKYYLILLLLGMCFQPVFAKAIPVEALQNFTTEKPSQNMKVKVLEEFNLDEDITIKEGCILNGKIVDVKDPKRLKRNATFKFVPLYYQNINEVENSITGYYPAKYTTKIKKGEVAKSAALGVGNYFVKGLSMGYHAVEGAVKNDKDNRFKSSMNAVYEDSPFSFVRKGEEIEIIKNQIFFLNFKIQNDDEDEENLPNYEYVELDKK